MPRPNNRLYELLLVTPDASTPGIHAAYLRMVQHLQAGSTRGAPDPTEALDELHRVYAVLSDPHLRSLYDRFGEAGLAPGFTPPPDELPPGPSAPPHDARVDLWVSFRRACLGGAGETMVDDQLIEVQIPPGSADGNELTSGRHIFRIRVDPDPELWRYGDQIHAEIALTEEEAVEGCSRLVQTLDGARTVHIPPGAQSGHRVVLHGLGIPHEDGTRSHMIVNVAIHG